VLLWALRKAGLTLAYPLLCPASRLHYPNVAVLVCCGEALSRTLGCSCQMTFHSHVHLMCFYRGRCFCRSFYLPSSFLTIESTANRLMTLFRKLSDQLWVRCVKPFNSHKSQDGNHNHPRAKHTFFRIHRYCSTHWHRVVRIACSSQKSTQRQIGQSATR
jgi:hypothetical protein